jgi:hypothetical protein
MCQFKHSKIKHTAIVIWDTYISKKKCEHMLHDFRFTIQNTILCLENPKKVIFKKPETIENVLNGNVLNVLTNKNK